MPESRIMTGRSSELRLRTRSCSRKKRSYLGRISIPMFFGDSHVLAMGLSSFFCVGFLKRKPNVREKECV